ncbi:FAD-binding protein, putative [Bodo saltans]|uniref:FAD-binding protein, putative n=1 Tax=Bodo saltans TaxID=75058 RepID=A0A0S4KHJ7_BODSA|nr:FAD-binding protein, putative [Bodo saltans]|eukprot:CUI15164.1 FAD-binding protein, putative [Bodo saltans]
MQFSNRLICMGSVVAVCSVIAAWKLLTKSCVTRTTLQRDIKVPTETPPSLLRVLQGAKIVVFYASCGGTATTLANLLVETLGDREVSSVLLVSPESVVDLDSFSSMMGSCNLCLGIIATTGDGSIPQNFQRIFSFLRCASASGASHFSILALGDSKYQYYCKAGEDVAVTLSQRGFCPCISDSGVTRSDAAQDPTHSRAYGLWVESILLTIPLHTDMVVGPLRTSPPIQRRFQVQSLVGDHGVDIGATIPFVLSPTMAEPTPTRPGRFSVKQLIHCLQADSEHQIAQITVGVNDYPKLTYEAGDHIAILSPNPTSVVDELLAFLDEGALTADTCVRIHHNTTSAARATPASSFPRPVVSWRFVLTWYLDISRVPAMQSVQHIIRCCDATTEEKVTMLEK